MPEGNIGATGKVPRKLKKLLAKAGTKEVSSEPSKPTLTGRPAPITRTPPTERKYREPVQGNRRAPRRPPKSQVIATLVATLLETDLTLYKKSTDRRRALRNIVAEILASSFKEQLDQYPWLEPKGIVEEMITQHIRPPKKEVEEPKPTKPKHTEAQMAQATKAREEAADQRLVVDSLHNFLQDEANKSLRDACAARTLDTDDEEEIRQSAQKLKLHHPNNRAKYVKQTLRALGDRYAREDAIAKNKAREEAKASATPKQSDASMTVTKPLVTEATSDPIPPALKSRIESAAARMKAEAPSTLDPATVERQEQAWARFKETHQ